MKQAEDALGLALEQRVKVVVNAGGLNPRGLADKLREVATGLGLDPRIAHVEGDDLRDQVGDLGLLHGAYGNPITANAYLGAFGIAAALDRGADLVVTGRVTDASVVVGPAIAHFGWTPESYDALAGAVVAGHIIECGTQATGGNFSGFVDLIESGAIRGGQPLGFPIAELAEDGSMVITKHDGTGGAVTVDTVTAQLVYEIQSTHYLNPDVTVDLTSLRLEQAGDDRVAVTGVTGSAPPEQPRGLNYFAGFRNSAEFVVTGLDCEQKVQWVREQVEAALGGDGPTGQGGVVRLSGRCRPDAETEEGASAPAPGDRVRPERRKVGKALTAPIIELALGSYPGFSVTRMPGPWYGVRRLPPRLRPARRGSAHGRPPRRRDRGDRRREDRGRVDRPDGRAAAVAVPRAHRHADPPAATGHLRPRPLG